MYKFSRFHGVNYSDCGLLRFVKLDIDVSEEHIASQFYVEEIGPRKFNRLERWTLACIYNNKGYQNSAYHDLKRSEIVKYVSSHRLFETS
jgi:hypothetical protein